MMRIGYDAKRAFNNTSGLGNYSRFVISGMQRYFPEDEYFYYTPSVAERFANFYAPSHRVQVRQPQGISKMAGGLWRSVGLASTLKKDEIQLFHGLSNELPLGISPRVKLVVTIHDLIFIRYPELYKPLDRLIYYQKFKYACQRADKIIAISEQTKQDIITYFKISSEKIEVVYQDCNPIFHQLLPTAILEQIKNKYGLPQQFILCVGTLEPRKNQLTLLKAWQQASLTQDLPIVFIGRRTDYAKELEHFLAQNQLTNQVLFLPYIATEELPVIYQLATLFVYPSVFEGFGIPILEALNSGVPVITSTGSCFSEAGGPDTLYASPGNTKELAQQLQKVIKDAALRQHMVQMGRKYAKRFRAEKTIRQMHQIYKYLLLR